MLRNVKLVQNTPRLGQVLPQFPSVPSQGGVEIHCYECGYQGPRLMTPSMAAQYPGGCELLSDDACATVPEAGTESPATASGFDGPTQIELTVLEGKEMLPLAGAAVTVQLVDRRDGSTSSGGSGTTDPEGKFYFERLAPSPNHLYVWRLSVSPTGQTPSFPEKEMEVPARTQEVASRGTGEPQLFTPAMTVCAAGTDSLICDVANAQMTFAAVYEQQLRAWNYETTGRPPQTASFAADQAHAAVRFTDPRLVKHWHTFSWWVGDLAIPPSDWPALVENFEQTMRVFNRIPFPEVDDYFWRCARGIPIYKGYSIGNPRLYSKTFSDYFPRHDYQIDADMAFQYLVNLEAIGKCIEHRIRQKVKEIERSAKTWRMMGLASTFMLAPLAGGAAPTLLATEISSYTYESLTGQVIPGDVEALVTSGVSLVSADPNALKQAVSIGAELLIQNLGKDLDPVVQNIATGAVTELTTMAVEDAVGGIVTDGAVDFVSLSGVGSAAAAFAVKMIADMITAQGVKGVEGLKNIILGLNTLDEQLVPFILWAYETLLLGQLFDAAAQLAAEQEGEIPADGAPPTTAPAPVETAPVGTAPVETAPGEVLPPEEIPGEEAPPEETVTQVPTDQGAPLTEFDPQADVVDPLVDQAEEAGVTVPETSTKPAVPIIDEKAKTTGDIAALSAIGAGGIIVALVGAGALGS